MNGSRESCLEETKCIITGLITSNPLRCTLGQLCRDFKNMVGYPIPFRKLGFEDPEEYLRSIPDTVRVYGSGPSAEVEGVFKQKSGHINEMVTNQRKPTVPAHKRRFVRKPSRHVPPTNSSYPPVHFTRRTTPAYTNVTRQTTPAYNNDKPQYSKGTYNNNEPQQSNASYNNDKPQQSTKSYNNDEPQYSNESYNNDENSEAEDNVSVGDNQKPPSESSEKDSEKDVCESPRDQFSEICVQMSDCNLEGADSNCLVPPQIQINLKRLIINHPQGILSTKLLKVYKETYHKSLNYESMSFRSVIEMCASLPNVFKYVQYDSDDYLLYDKDQPQPSLHTVRTENGTVINEHVAESYMLEEMAPFDWSEGSPLIPQDVVHLCDMIPRYFPSDLEIGNYLDVGMAEIYDLSKFWVYPQFGELGDLMKDLQQFFAERSNQYLIPKIFLSEGLYCVVKYSNLYHRAIVVNLLATTIDFVRVLCIDYGTVENVSTDEIWFLPKQFGKLPSQAIRCRLALIAPPVENTTWSAEAIIRFKQLTTDAALVANILGIDKEDMVFDVYLAEISNPDTIYYINETLANEGYALSSDKERIKGPEANYKPNVRNVHLYPDFLEIEKGYAPMTNELNYIITQKVPLHHYIPQYFDMKLEDEDMKEIETNYINCSNQSYHTIGVYYRKMDHSKDYLSLFPEEIVDDIRAIVRLDQELQKCDRLISNRQTEAADTEYESLPARDSPVKEYACFTKRKNQLVSMETPSIDNSDNRETSIEHRSSVDYNPSTRRSVLASSEESNHNSDAKEEQTECEDEADSSVRQYTCSPLRRSQLASKEEPLNNTETVLNSTNPFLNGSLLEADYTPLHPTNPFINDLKKGAFETINLPNQIFNDIRSESKVKDVNKSDALVNNSRSALEIVQTIPPLNKVHRPPPGFSPRPQYRQMPQNPVALIPNNSYPPLQFPQQNRITSNLVMNNFWGYFHPYQQNFPPMHPPGGPYNYNPGMQPYFNPYYRH